MAEEVVEESFSLVDLSDVQINSGDSTETDGNGGEEEEEDRERSSPSSDSDNSQMEHANQDSFITDVDFDESVVIEEKSSGEATKINVMDIFKMARPSKVRMEEVILQDELKASEEHVLNCQGTSESVVEPVVELPEVEKVEKAKPDAPKSGITALDILIGNRKQKKVEGPPAPAPAPVDVVSIDVHSDHEVEVVKSGITVRDILTGTKKKEPDADVVEILTSEDEQELNSKKRVKGKHKHSKKDKKGKKEKLSMIIKLRYKPEHKRIAEIEEKIRKSASKSISAKDLFGSFNKKKKMMVTLKVEPDKLKTLNKPTFFEKGVSVPGAKSYLDMLSHKPTPIKNPIYKLKEVPTPDPTREQLHVTYDQPEFLHRRIDLPSRDHVILDEIDYSNIEYNVHKVEHPHQSLHLETTFKPNAELLDEALQRVPQLKTDPRFKRFYEVLQKGQTEINHDTWTNTYKPKSVDEILINPTISNSIKLWIENSFKILKRNTKRPNFKKQKKADDEIDDFIVNDDYDNELTDEDTYVPMLIISGPTGAGKSTTVYSIVEEELSGYVHEVNASQDRGRKDIMSNLTELSTTQLVHHNEDIKKNNDFQKGVILFEDVDILFESDRGFWSVLVNLLMISRRPMILTCSDISVIPSYILKVAEEEGNIFNLERQSLDLLKNYLYLIGISNRFDVTDDVLITLIQENNYDLRKCLMNLQVICKGNNMSVDEVLLISKSPVKQIPKSIEDETSIGSFMEKIDSYSISDIIGNNPKSLINHEILEDEVISEDVILNEEELYTAPLPFEFNLSKELEAQLPSYPLELALLNIKEIRILDKLYIKSKLKEFKRLTRGSLGSSMLFDDSNEIYDKSCFELLPTAKYIIDVSPMLREFARYDSRIEQYNKQVIETDPEGRTKEQLIKDNQLVRRKFDMPPSYLLYNSLKYWV